jgi:taurine dioxygenase
LRRVAQHGQGWYGFQLTPDTLPERLGALVNVGDVRQLNATGAHRILRAVRDFGVVVIRGQDLTRSEQVAFSAALGEVVVLPGSFEGQDPEPAEPAIQRVTNFWANGTWKGAGKSFGAYWHQDGQFWPRSHRHILSMLYASAAPKTGGQTGFADLRTALSTLSRPLLERARRARILASVRDIPDFIRYGTKEELELFDDVEHPMVDTMPDSTGTSLYDSGADSAVDGAGAEDSAGAGDGGACARGECTLFIGSPQMRTLGVADGRGEELLKLLFAHATGPSFSYYHHWTPGDIVIWDNVQTLHHAFGYENDGTVRRELFRTQVRLRPSEEHMALASDGAGRPRWLGDDGLPVWVSGAAPNPKGKGREATDRDEL